VKLVGIVKVPETTHGVIGCGNVPLVLFPVSDSLTVNGAEYPV
jgi:hypothetical protein